MSAHRAVLLALFVVVGTLVVPVTATSDYRADGTDARVETLNDSAGTGVAAAPNGSNNTSLGLEISAFMQTSAAEVGGAVETGMWTAEFNETSNRSVRVRLVERRTRELRSELTDLQERKQELIAQRDSANVSDTAYQAKLSYLLGRIDALQTAINATAPRARAVNANVEAVAELRTKVRNLTGPEIAAIARNVTGVSAGHAGPGNGTGVGNGQNGNGQNGVGNGQSGVDAGENGVGNGQNGVGSGQNGVGDGTDAGQNGPANTQNGTDVGQNSTGEGRSGVNGGASNVGAAGASSGNSTAPVGTAGASSGDSGPTVSHSPV